MVKNPWCKIVSILYPDEYFGIEHIWFSHEQSPDKEGIWEGDRSILAISIFIWFDLDHLCYFLCPVVAHCVIVKRKQTEGEEMSVYMDENWVKKEKVS